METNLAFVNKHSQILMSLTTIWQAFNASLPDREKGEELCPLVPPFSLLLRDEDELGLGVNALLESWRVLQSEKGADKHENKNLKSKQEV